MIDTGIRKDLRLDALNHVVMKAFVVDRYRSEDGLRAGEMPDPEPRTPNPEPEGGEVLATGPRAVIKRTSTIEFSMMSVGDPLPAFADCRKQSSSFAFERTWRRPLDPDPEATFHRSDSGQRHHLDELNRGTQIPRLQRGTLAADKSVRWPRRRYTPPARTPCRTLVTSAVTTGSALNVLLQLRHLVGEYAHLLREARESLDDLLKPRIRAWREPITRIKDAVVPHLLSLSSLLSRFSSFSCFSCFSSFSNFSFFSNFSGFSGFSNFSGFTSLT